MKILKINDVLYCAARAQGVFQQPVRAIFGKDNVLRERALRNAKGERVRDNSAGGDGTGRNIDFVVKGKDGKWRPVEVTSKTADKAAQLNKEKAIRNGSSSFRVELVSENPS